MKMNSEHMAQKH